MTPQRWPAWWQAWAAATCTLAGIADRIEHEKGTKPIDPDWLKRVTGLIGQLEN